ncbi:mannitol-1-phosphate 5-dehydrogenase [Paenibacillus sp. TRM 82003]|nr:mannitol-1-phosphate 5-dehydrogenase [Paenibacillus sp. TRM 82003]
MRAVHFGAGNIGRGFIGLLLSKSGYEVSFVVRNEKTASLIKKRKQYEVTLANDNWDAVTVRNVTAMNIRDTEEVSDAIAEADLVTTAVGVSALADIAKPIAAGLERRLQRREAPIHVIACENAIGGSSLLKEKVMSLLPAELHPKAERTVAFPNAAVDRIVPIQHNEDPLSVTVEPFFEWVIDRSAMIEGFSPIRGVQYVDALEPYVERKLFTVNTAHCCAAYHGYLEGYQTIQDVMGNRRLKQEIQGVLHETGSYLVKKYQWDEAVHQQYIHKIIERFSNMNLIDRVVRVARSPLRKLSPGDRLVKPATKAHELGIEVPHLAAAISAAMLFDYNKDPEAVKLQRAIMQKGASAFVSGYMGIPTKHPMHREIVSRYEEYRQKYFALRRNS